MLVMNCTYWYNSCTMALMPDHKTTEESERFQVPIIGRGDGYDLAWAAYVQGKNYSRMSDLLNEKRHTIKDTDQSYRTINHWSSLGLIEDERTNNSSWRKLSMLDLIWIQIISKLRQFGFPLEKLLVTQKELFGGKPDRSPYRFFEFAISEVFLKLCQYLVVLPDGRAAVMSEERLHTTMSLYYLDNFICISLNTIVSNIYKNHDFSPALQYFEVLTKEEADVLFQMRSGKYESVGVKMNNGEIVLIEATQTIDAQKRLIDLLKDADYQDIQLKTATGKIVSIKRTVKIKPASKATENLRASSTEPLRSSDKPKSKAVRSNAHD